MKAPMHDPTRSIPHVTADTNATMPSSPIRCPIQSYPFPYKDISLSRASRKCQITKLKCPISVPRRQWKGFDFWILAFDIFSQSPQIPGIVSPQNAHFPCSMRLDRDAKCTRWISRSPHFGQNVLL